MALDALKFNPKSVYGKRHREHFLGDCARLVEIAGGNSQGASGAVWSMASTPATFGIMPGERSRGGLVVAFPPTYKAGYERLYKRLHANVEWQEAAYRVWDPKDIEAWLAELRDLGVRALRLRRP